jgi:N-acetyl-anhydromuramyl-L-alanine amidase AmpD
MAEDRVTPHVVVRKIVRNQSSRHGVRPKLIVVHATQSANRAGTGDLEGVGSWFDNPVASASSHVCTDANEQSARFVADAAKAWHVANWNSLSLGIEQIGFAEAGSWSDAEQRETARWIARWSVLHGIPIQKGQVRQDRIEVIRWGVVRHSDLGPLGGGHHDPGAAYPLHDVLDMARAYRRRL